MPRGLRRRPRTGHHQLPHRRPGDRADAAPPCAAAARLRSDALLPCHHLPGRRQRGAHQGVRGGRRAARRVLLRPRGDRSRLAGAGRRLADRLPLRHGAVPPDDRTLAARRLPPHGGPQPRLARPAQPPGPARPRLPRRLAAAHPGPPSLPGGPAGLVRRLQGGLDRILRSAPPDALAHGLAAHPAGPAPGHLRSFLPEQQASYRESPGPYS
ncbi:hypothetical protein SGPA1_10274 [Streptomyces misionensis JCM 4497]